MNQKIYNILKNNNIDLLNINILDENINIKPCGYAINGSTSDFNYTGNNLSEYYDYIISFIKSNCSSSFSNIEIIIQNMIKYSKENNDNKLYVIKYNKDINQIQIFFFNFKIEINTIFYFFTNKNIKTSLKYYNIIYCSNCVGCLKYLIMFVL